MPLFATLAGTSAARPLAEQGCPSGCSGMARGARRGGRSWGRGARTGLLLRRCLRMRWRLRTAAWRAGPVHARATARGRQAGGSARVWGCAKVSTLRRLLRMDWRPRPRPLLIRAAGWMRCGTARYVSRGSVYGWGGSALGAAIRSASVLLLASAFELEPGGQGRASKRGGAACRADNGQSAQCVCEKVCFAAARRLADARPRSPCPAWGLACYRSRGLCADSGAGCHVPCPGAPGPHRKCWARVHSMSLGRARPGLVDWAGAAWPGTWRAPWRRLGRHRGGWGGAGVPQGHACDGARP